jgi:hypothetical protein
MSRCGTAQVGIASVFRWRVKLVICRKKYYLLNIFNFYIPLT